MTLSTAATNAMLALEEAMLGLVEGSDAIPVVAHTTGMAQLDGDFVVERLDMRARVRFPQMQSCVWAPRKEKVNTMDELGPDTVLFVLERKGCPPLYFSISRIEVRRV